MKMIVTLAIMICSVGGSLAAQEKGQTWGAYAYATIRCTNKLHEQRNYLMVSDVIPVVIRDTDVELSRAMKDLKIQFLAYVVKNFPKVVEPGWYTSPNDPDPITPDGGWGGNYATFPEQKKKAIAFWTNFTVIDIVKVATLPPFEFKK